MRWRLARDRQLLVRSWDGDSVVYDCAGGDTHLLGAPLARVFARVQQGPCELDEAIALELAALGLVERAA
jgi:PqqD family protein of HPr-rel-A system